MFKNILAGFAVLTLTACTTFNNGLPSMSDADYLKASPAERNAHLSAVVKSSAALQDKKDVEYNAGQPVVYGDGDTKYTRQWVKLPGEYDAVAVYPGHNPKGLSGAVHEGMYLALADKKGNMLYRTGPNGVVSPIPLLANVAASEDFEAAMWKAGIGGFSNGGLSAIINKTVPCADCGTTGPAMVNQVVTSANSKADSATLNQTSVSANVGGCGTGGCMGLPVK